MRKTALILILFASAASVGQTSTTQSSCSAYGNTLNCANVAQQPVQQQAQDSPQYYPQGYQVGQAIGNAVANRRAKQWVKKYCKSHPGEAWWYSSAATGYRDGTCPD